MKYSHTVAMVTGFSSFIHEGSRSQLMRAGMMAAKYIRFFLKKFIFIFFAHTGFAYIKKLL